MASGVGEKYGSQYLFALEATSMYTEERSLKVSVQMYRGKTKIKHYRAITSPWFEQMHTKSFKLAANRNAHMKA